MPLDPPATRPQRQEMVQRQLIQRNITDPRVLEAMATIPREIFIPSPLQEEAYLDGPIPIGCGQTISQPYMVAIMAQLLRPDGKGTFLEIGTGSGYGAAILSQLAEKVVTVERIPLLLEQAQKRWQLLGLNTIEGIEADGTLGYPEKAPYDGICVTAGAPSLPTGLPRQLKPIRGQLVIPVGPRFSQTLQSVYIDNQGEMITTQHFSCIFVPLIGHHGWGGVAAKHTID